MSGLWVREAQGICCVMISHSTWGWGGMWGDGIWWLVDVRAMVYKGLTDRLQESKTK